MWEGNTLVVGLLRSMYKLPGLVSTPENRQDKEAHELYVNNA